VRHRANCISALTARRLVSEGYEGRPVVLPGLYAGPAEAEPAEATDPGLIVYAGRHVREKRLDLLVRGFALARERRPELRLDLFGDGPDRPRVEELVRSLGLDGSVHLLGKRPEEEVAGALARAACLATASEREGYGLVVVEAAARGTPSVVVAGPDNAATELVEEGVNGAIAADASPDALADALVRVVGAGAALRASTAAWFAERVDRLTVAASLETVIRGYAEVRSGS
jgi:glycosyltransferase involved in cell wall biosynthesis